MVAGGHRNQRRTRRATKQGCVHTRTLTVAFDGKSLCSALRCVFQMFCTE